MSVDLALLLPDLPLFVAVARTRSFSRAARALRMPVSTLSRRITDYEKKLGVPLLIRTTRKVELTEVGQRYLDRCRVVLESAELAQAELIEQSDEPRGVLRISATQDFASLHLRPVLADFMTRFPELSFELDLTARRVDLIDEGVDIAIRMGRLPDSQLLSRKLGAMPTALYASPTYLDRAGQPKRPADLSRHQCLRILGGTGTPTRWSFTRTNRTESVEVRGRIVVNSMRVLLELAHEGLGIALLDETAGREAESSGELVRVLPDWKAPLVPVHALMPSRHLEPKVRRFLDALSARLQGAP